MLEVKDGINLELLLGAAVVAVQLLLDLMDLILKMEVMVVQAQQVQ
tara:strand:+ start:371 stop:508 length:138 start_codon:yes stop_codon:yes gene_type:complete